MNKISSLFVILFVMFSASSANAYSCGSAKIVIDHPRYNEVLQLARALYDPDYGVIALSSSIMGEHSPNVRKFIFAHECGHYKMSEMDGGSEIAADNYAIRATKGIRFSEAEKQEICRDIGPARCANFRRKTQ